MPQLLARMAEWLVAPPISVTMPSTLALSMAAVSEGSNSFAATITGRSRLSRPRAGAPCKMRSRRSFTSERSAARSRIRASGALPSTAR